MEIVPTPEMLVQKLFLQHAASLRGFIFGLMPDRAAADDVFQDVFVTATKRATDFERDRSFLFFTRLGMRPG